MERIGVIIADGVVVNTILWADHTSDQLQQDGYKNFEEVTNLDPCPGIGWLWDATNGYRPPKPFESWVWSDGSWSAPKAMPKTGGPYAWNEETQTWDAIPTPSE